jgi:molybdopterin molybdotransferase
MIGVAEALAIVEGETRPLGKEPVPLHEAAGRVLAENVTSDVDWPPFDTSAMDGYAVFLRDAATPGASALERSGVVAAGNPPPAPLAPGEAVRIMTGAPIPEGAEAVVPVEKAERRDGRVVFSAAPAAGAHLRRRGESIAAGTQLLSPGLPLTPGRIALAALAGRDPIAVYRKPRIGIAVTGNELVAASEKPGPGQIRDSNGPMLAALCETRRLEPRLLPRVSDDSAGLARLLTTAVGSELDVLLTTGGVSAGDFDLLPAEAVRQGFAMLFHRVAVRPGKPIAFGRRGSLLWFGLPGNPVSAAVCFHVFVRHALDRLEGAARPGPERVTALLTRVARQGARESFRDAFLSADKGSNRVELLLTAGSHDLAAHGRSNALARIPAGDGLLAAGTEVECILLERG